MISCIHVALRKTLHDAFVAHSGAIPHAGGARAPGGVARDLVLGIKAKAPQAGTAEISGRELADIFGLKGAERKNLLNAFMGASIDASGRFALHLRHEVSLGLGDSNLILKPLVEGRADARSLRFSAGVVGVKQIIFVFQLDIQAIQIESHGVRVIAAGGHEEVLPYAAAR